MVQYYRADVYEHPEEQEAFEEQYGYELAPATNYEELRFTDIQSRYGELPVLEESIDSY